jgi:hypothetical protein
LKKRLSQLPKLRVHQFGHHHDRYGTLRVGKVSFINAAVDDQEQPFVFDLDTSSASPAIPS